MFVNFDNLLIQKTVRRYVGGELAPDPKETTLMISLKQEQRMSLDDAMEVETLIDNKC